MLKSLSRPSARHISSLDGFRGIAFLLVFARHYALSSHTNSRMVHTAMAVGQGGWIGVDLFFTLSGLLITGILLDTRGNLGYFRNFFARRILRIFPLYYGVFFLLILLTPILHLQWHWGHLLYLAYLGNIAGLLHKGLVEIVPAVSLLHLWSLSVEEQFYLLWPCVIFFIARRRHLAWVCVGLSVLALAIRVALLGMLPIETAYEWCYALLPTHMDGLLYGALAALWIRSRPLQSIQPIARGISLASGVALAGVYAVGGFDFHSRSMTVAGYPVLAALFASILLQALAPHSWASSVGNVRILRFFGKYSYGLYVYHLLFHPGLSRLQPVLQRELHSVVMGGLLFVSLQFVGSIVVAVVSYNLYEKRWLALKRYFEYKEPVPAGPQTV
ncbi:MAG: acyltransferase [Edaphobacter sp.]